MNALSILPNVKQCRRLAGRLVLCLALACMGLNTVAAHPNHHGGGHYHGGVNPNAGIAIGVAAGALMIGTVAAMAASSAPATRSQCLVSVGRPVTRCHYNHRGFYRCHRHYRQHWVAC